MKSRLTYFGIFGALCLIFFFFVEFRDRLFMDFGFILLLFFGICLYLSASLVLVIFGNISIRKGVSCKSEGIKFSTFSACFVEFVSSVVFIRLCYLFEVIRGSILHNFSERNCSGNRFKKVPPPTLLEIYQHTACPAAPRDAASRAHNSNKKR